MNILIVEDDVPMALIIAALLRPVAKKIEEVHTLAEAFSLLLLAKKNFDAVLLDLNLPDSRPNDTLDAIRRIKETGTKVIVMTGADVSDLQAVAIDHGADACFYKGNSEFVGWLKRTL